MTPEGAEVQVGQVWADNDPRSAGRTLRVEFVGTEQAACRVLTNADAASAVPPANRVVRIRLDRFRPTATGYRLVSEPEGGVR